MNFLIKKMPPGFKWWQVLRKQYYINIIIINKIFEKKYRPGQ